MDVKGLYPNLIIAEVLKIILKMVEESGLDFEGVDWSEVGKYLVVNVTRQELEALGLGEVVPKRKGADRKVTMAYLDGGEKNKKNTEKWNKLWNMPNRRPNGAEQAKMMSKIVEIATKEVMSRHFYAIGDKIMKQAEGGPIGLQLSQAIARLVMLWWDERFLEKAKTSGLEIEMYERFVDDSNLTSELIEPGWRYDHVTGKVIFNAEWVEDDSNMEDDRRTASVVREVANTVHPMIQMEEDIPSNHADSKIPILDLKCWIGADGQIWFHHYEKPMASKLVLPARSALPMSQKRNIHINECVRRLRNCKPEMEWERKKECVQDYVVRLYHAGYTEQFRHNIVKQAVARYDGMVEADREGTHPLYRDQNWQKQIRHTRRQTKKTDWLKKGNYDTVIMVNATPGGELAKRYKAVVKDNPGPVKIKIMEQGGRQVKSMLQRNNPGKTRGCNSPDCLACKQGRGKGGDCRKNNVGYELVCDLCGAESVCYVGETAQNVYTRGLKHIANYRGKQKDSPLWKHAQMEHEGSLEVSFSMKVVKAFTDPLTRQVNEAVRIENCSARTQLNSKSEWHGPATVRLVAEGGGWG